jgi:hypothetical protein
MFNLRDTVRKIGTDKTGIVEETRHKEHRYWVQFGKNFDDRQWCKEDELELVSAAPTQRR